MLKTSSLVAGLLIFFSLSASTEAATINTDSNKVSKKTLFVQFGAQETFDRGLYHHQNSLRVGQEERRRAEYNRQQNEIARIERIRQSKQSARASIPELESKEDYLNLAIAWRILEEWDKGLDAAEKAIAAYPNVARPYVVRATIKIELKDIAGAIADYSRAIVVEPDFHGFYKVRGRLKGRADRHGAIQDFRTAMKLVRVDNNYNLIRDSELRLLTEELRSLGATEKETF
jgi:tetratricopeptide (TPR) repeat protein